MIDLSEDKSCLKRSVYAGLKYAGIEDKCNWIPLNAKEEDLYLIIKRYPILRISGHYTYSGKAVPLLVVYDTNISDEHGKIYHAIFVSDSCPFDDELGYFQVKCIISGWEELAEHPIVLRWYKYMGTLMDYYKRFLFAIGIYNLI